jgi:uncharacterized protein (DUF1330 family)
MLMAGVALLAAKAADTPPPRPAYVIGEVTVHDPEGYKAYVAAVTPVVARFGGTYLARGGRTVAVEGDAPAGRVVILAFPSVEAAEAFEGSADGKAAAALRQRASRGRFFIVEGVAR